jgi:hypothetical protein
VRRATFSPAASIYPEEFTKVAPVPDLVSVYPDGVPLLKSKVQDGIGITELSKGHVENCLANVCLLRFQIPPESPVAVFFKVPR